MIRKLMAVAAVSGLMISTALAESPNAANDKVTTPTGARTEVITQQSSNQWLGSILIGMSVVDPDNNTIGDVNDILVEKDGRIQALIVGVGGFLGMGEKDVALPMASFKIVPANSDANKSSTDQLRLSMTKDQLQQHAEFRSTSGQASTTGSGASTGRRSGGATGSDVMAPNATPDNAGAARPIAPNSPPAGTAR